MSRRTTRTARARRSNERDARRESLLVLIARTQRGSSLIAAEAALLRAHVEAEVEESDRYRAEAGGQATAVRREQQRTRAAEEAIREAEQRALDAEEQLTAYRSVFGRRPLDTHRDALARAQKAEAQTSRVRELAHRMRAGSPQGAAAIYAERIEQALDGDPDALTAGQSAEQQLAAVRAVLPTEPRPRLGLPNTLAYEDGRHDQADAVRDALGEQVRT